MNRRHVGHAAGIRANAERKADVLIRLTSERNVWIATAGHDGVPHLVPVSLCWHQPQVVLATRDNRPLARDLAASGRARLGLGDGEDVVLIDAIAPASPWTAADPGIRQAFVRQAGWDPGGQPGEWVLLRLVPYRIQAWRTVEENLRGSVVMRDGQWVSWNRDRPAQECCSHDEDGEVRPDCRFGTGVGDSSSRGSQTRVGAEAEAQT